MNERKILEAAARAEIERLKGTKDVQLGANSDHAESEQQRELAGALEVGQLLGGSSHEAAGDSETKGKFVLIDDFRGDLDQLVASVTALIELDIAGVLVPHGIGNLARGLLSALCVRVCALQQQLAAEQAKNVKLLDFIAHAQVSSGVCCCGEPMDGHSSPMSCGHSPVDMWDHAVGKLLDAPSDTSALEAIVKKAGEVMREECITVAGPEDSYQDDWFKAKADACNRIRALPAVTLEDLK